MFYQLEAHIYKCYIDCKKDKMLYSACLRLGDRISQQTNKRSPINFTMIDFNSIVSLVIPKNQVKCCKKFEILIFRLQQSNQFFNKQIIGVSQIRLSDAKQSGIIKFKLTNDSDKCALIEVSFKLKAMNQNQPFNNIANAQFEWTTRQSPTRISPQKKQQIKSNNSKISMQGKAQSMRSNHKKAKSNYQTSEITCNINQQQFVQKQSQSITKSKQFTNKNQHSSQLRLSKQLQYEKRISYEKKQRQQIKSNSYNNKKQSIYQKQYQEGTQNTLFGTIKLKNNRKENTINYHKKNFSEYLLFQKPAYKCPIKFNQTTIFNDDQFYQTESYIYDTFVGQTSSALFSQANNRQMISRIQSIQNNNVPISNKSRHSEVFDLNTNKKQKILQTASKQVQTIKTNNIKQLSVVQNIVNLVLLNKNQRFKKLLKICPITTQLSVNLKQNKSFSQYGVNTIKKQHKFTFISNLTQHSISSYSATELKLKNEEEKILQFQNMKKQQEEWLQNSFRQQKEKIENFLTFSFNQKSKLQIISLQNENSQIPKIKKKQFETQNNHQRNCCQNCNNIVENKEKSKINFKINLFMSICLKPQNFSKTFQIKSIENAPQKFKKLGYIQKKPNSKRILQQQQIQEYKKQSIIKKQTLYQKQKIKISINDLANQIHQILTEQPSDHISLKDLRIIKQNEWNLIKLKKQKEEQNQKQPQISQVIKQDDLQVQDQYDQESQLMSQGGSFVKEVKQNYYNQSLDTPWNYQQIQQIQWQFLQFRDVQVPVSLSKQQLIDIMSQQKLKKSAENLQKRSMSELLIEYTRIKHEYQVLVKKIKQKQYISKEQYGNMNESNKKLHQTNKVLKTEIKTLNQKNVNLMLQNSKIKHQMQKLTNFIKQKNKIILYMKKQLLVLDSIAKQAQDEGKKATALVFQQTERNNEDKNSHNFNNMKYSSNSLDRNRNKQGFLSNIIENQTQANHKRAFSHLYRQASESYTYQIDKNNLNTNNSRELQLNIKRSQYKNNNPWTNINKVNYDNLSNNYKEKQKVNSSAELLHKTKITTSEQKYKNRSNNFDKTNLTQNKNRKMTYKRMFNNRKQLQLQQFSLNKTDSFQIYQNKTKKNQLQILDFLQTQRNAD